MFGKARYLRSAARCPASAGATLLPLLLFALPLAAHTPPSTETTPVPAGAARLQQPSALPAIRWVTESDLQQASLAAEVEQVLAEGGPVAIIRTGNDPDGTGRRALQRRFGLATDAAVLAYVRPRGKPLVALALAELPEEPDSMREALDQFGRLVASHATPGSGDHLGVSSSKDPDDVAMLPRLQFTTVTYDHRTRGHVTLNSEIVRDVQQQGSRLLLVLHSTHSMRPLYYGLQANGGIVIPHTYYTGHLVAPVDNGGNLLRATLVDRYPLSDGRTDIEFNRTITTETTFGVGVSRETGSAIHTSTGTTASSKLAGSFDFARTNSISRHVGYSIKDYSVASSGKIEELYLSLPSPRPGRRNWLTSAVEWSHQLAPGIDHNKHYFRTNGPNSPHSGERMTPTMEQLNAEVSSTWELPELSPGGSLEVVTGGRIKFLFNPRHRDAPQQRMFLQRHEGPQAWASWSISMDSPFLTRFPTVRLRSRHGDGNCLFDHEGGVTLEECPTLDDSNLIDLQASADQWILDSASRYVNRATGRCLTWDVTQAAGQPDIVTRACTTSNAQRWVWAADRIHNLYNDGSRFGVLHVRRDGRPGAQLQLPAPVSIPLNPHHVLLNPWSSYPAAPTAGDFIPTISGVAPKVPESYLALPAIPATERWEPVLIRQAAGQ